MQRGIPCGLPIIPGGRCDFDVAGLGVGFRCLFVGQLEADGEVGVGAGLGGGERGGDRFERVFVESQRRWRERASAKRTSDDRSDEQTRAARRALICRPPSSWAGFSVVCLWCLLDAADLAAGA